MLMVCIRSCMKSELLNLESQNPDTLREQGCRDPWLFFEAKRCWQV